MSRANLNDLQAFVVIAREGSFTRAAAQLGVSQSALSHTLRALETRLGVRLLTRTTRSVSPTEAGQRLYQTVAPRFEEIELELTAISEFRDTPAGTVRISASEHAANNILWPKLLKVLPDYPMCMSKSPSTTPSRTLFRSVSMLVCVWASRWPRI